MQQISETADKHFIVRQRAWVLMLTDFGVLTVAMLVLISSTLFRTTPLPVDSLVAVGSVILASVVSLGFLWARRAVIAAHVTVAAMFFGLVVLNVVGAEQAYAKSETSYILAALILPALLLGRTWTIVYGVLSVALIGYMSCVIAGVPGVPPNAVLGFFVDNAASIVFVVFFTSLISGIYERTLSAMGRLLVSQERLNEEQRDLTQRLRESEAHKRQFYRDTIYSVTDGKLMIGDPSDTAPYLESAELSIPIPNASALTDVRHEIEEYCTAHGLNGADLDQFMIAIGEALTNAVKHGLEAHAYAGRDSRGIWVAVSDQGPGIESLILPKAVLLKGFSTKPSLGLGYTVILDVSDHVILQTGKTGTTVIMFKYLKPQPEISLENIPDTW